MPDSPTTTAKQTPKKGTTALDQKKSLFSSPPSSFGTRRSMAFAYCFTFAFVACTIFFVFNNPSNYHSSIFFTNILKTRSHFSSIFSLFFPNTTSSTSSPRDSFGRSQIFRFPFSREKDWISGKINNSSNSSNNSSLSAYKTTSSENQVMGNMGLNGPTKRASKNSHEKFAQEKDGLPGKSNRSSNGRNEPSSSAYKTKSSENQELSSNGPVEEYSENSHTNQTSSSQSVKSASMKGSADKNVTVNSLSHSVKNASTEGVVDRTTMANSLPKSMKNASRTKGSKETNMMPNHPALAKEQSGRTNGASMALMAEQRKDNWLEVLRQCDIFDGTWVKDDSYPLYAAGSCPLIDEPFDCFLSGRRDNGYEKFRWQPKGCNIPRLNGRDLLELLKGKRLVYVGDSLNRNMWESMVCTLRSSVKDKSKVFEASGRHEFQTDGSYSFLFTDYNCSVEFFRSTFLVQEWEMPDTSGLKKETLRLDLIERSSDRYISADILVFNTGHWWTHEKTSQGKDYYQEGSHVYGELNVIEAFRKAMTTWARWIDANINPTKTLVFFRGYSASHFSGGLWKSGGQCDHETEPIKNEAYLSQYPPIMSMLERVMKGMKTPVFYLNVTKITDFRKDAHPSIYRKRNLTEEEKRSPLRFQDCSHWCLPGVPDTWNELLYAQLYIEHNQKQQQQQNKQQQQQQKRQ